MNNMINDLRAWYKQNWINMCEHVAIKTHHSINMFSKMTFENAYAMVNENNDHSVPLHYPSL